MHERGALGSSLPGTVGLLTVALASLHALAGCGPCEDGCSGGPPPDPTTTCVAPPSEDTVTLLGDSDTFQMEFGPQGGQHFYVAVALRDLLPGEVFHLRFETDDGESWESMPWIEGTCAADQAYELRDIAFQLPEADDFEGTLTASIGSCAVEYCTWTEDGHVSDFTPRADASRSIVVVAP